MKVSVENKVIARLKGFTNALKDKETLADEFTCRKVQLTLEPTSYSPELVRETRKAIGASQAIFAQFLGVSRSTVQSWEQGDRPPNDIACRFMDEIRHNPEWWQDRLKELVKERVSEPC